MYHYNLKDFNFTIFQRARTFNTDIFPFPPWLVPLLTVSLRCQIFAFSYLTIFKKDLWSRVDDSDWGTRCSRCAGPKANIPAGAPRWRWRAQLPDWPLNPSFVWEQLVGFPLLPGGPQEPYLRGGKPSITTQLFCFHLSLFEVLRVGDFYWLLQSKFWGSFPKRPMVLLLLRLSAKGGNEGEEANSWE